jgi:maltose O-acetyltransferase
VRTWINRIFDRIGILDRVAIFLVHRAQRRQILDYMATHTIHPTVRLGNVFLDLHVSIGEGTYMRSGQVFAGPNSQVVIGRFCAIGYNVHIKARSHDPEKPTRTGWEDQHQRLEADIVIGDHVWIGDNVFIGPGINVGNHAIIGANAVVTRNVPAYAVVGGVPARLIRMREADGDQTSSKNGS